MNFVLETGETVKATEPQLEMNPALKQYPNYALLKIPLDVWNAIVELSNSYYSNNDLMSATYERQRKRYANLVFEDCFDPVEQRYAVLEEEKLTKLFNCANICGNHMCSLFVVRAKLQSTLKQKAKC